MKSMLLKGKTKQASRARKNAELIRSTLQKVLKYGIIFLLALSTSWFWFKLKNPHAFPIHNVSVTGDYSHISNVELQATILPYTHSSFFAINIEALKQKLSENPWIDQVEIKRVWPSQLLIHIEEQKPVAIWNGNSLLNNSGVVFSPNKNTFPLNLPVFQAPAEQQKLVLESYYNFSNQLASLGLSIVGLELTPRLAWYIRLNNGLALVLGREKTEERLQRFMQSYSTTIANKYANIDYIDLRYPNGFAVKWKNQPVV